MSGSVCLPFYFFLNDPPTPKTSPLPLPDALPIYRTRPPRWQRRKEARPAEIVAAALEVFVERGFAAAKLADVARRAGEEAALHEHLERGGDDRSEEHTSELQSQSNLVCRLLLEKT